MPFSEISTLAVPSMCNFLLGAGAPLLCHVGDVIWLFRQKIESSARNPEVCIAEKAYRKELKVT
jgi:hypothetical protein